MKINYRIPFMFGGLIVLTSAVINFNFYNSHLKLLNTAKQERMANIVNVIEYDLIQQANRAAARASLISNLPSVIEAFGQHDRSRLLKELKPAFIIQHDKYDVQEAQFHLPPAISFLRLYASDVGKNEDLSKFRSMVLAVNKKQYPIQGIEIGRRGLSIRSISIVKDNHGPIGSFEVGLDFNPLLRDVKHLTDSDVGIFVDNNLIRNIAIYSAPLLNNVIGSYQMLNATDEEVIRTLIKPDSLESLNDVTYKYITLNNIDYGIALIPLIDYSGAEIGIIAAVANFADAKKQLNIILIESIIYTFLQVIVLMGGLLIIINGFLIKPFLFLNTKLADVAEGKTDVDVGKYQNLHDEIGLMAKSINKVKQLLAKKASNKPRKKE